jgi:hypothetical protein
MSSNYALLIGSNYTSIPSIQLKGCINDIVNMKHMLIDAYGFPINNITLLRDDISDSAFIPTRANILFELNNIVRQNATFIWIHYSGHGTQIIDTNQEVDDCIVPCDYTSTGYITQDEIYDIIKQISCKAYITIDACHSGSLCELAWSFSFIDQNRYSKTKTTNIDLSNSNIYMISGCRDNQTSADSFDFESQIPMGAFTDALIICLRRLSHNTPILFLYKEVCIYLQSAGYTQVPVLSCSSEKLSEWFIRATL